MSDSARVWLIWLQSQSLSLPPSEFLGLQLGSYEAYCFNEAVWFFGTTVTNELEAAGQKRSKGDGRVQSARKRVLDKFLGKPDAPKQFADPALLFQNTK